MRAKLIFPVVILLAALAWPPRAAHADIAPPKTPPGSTLLPGDESTAVRMVSEIVTLDVAADPQNAGSARAVTTAAFTMRNLGHVVETMGARFPLSFLDGSSDGMLQFPEISSIAVKVDGRPVATRREMQPPIEGGGYRERDEIPWAVFDVTFPLDRDVEIEVKYAVSGYGYYPQASFDYVLETGAGWHDNIGSADIIVRLPYPADAANTYIDESALSAISSPNAALHGGEIRWHFEEFEPTAQDNIVVVLLAPSLWQTVLREQEVVSANAGDGEAWGRLAKAYKEAARLPKGWLRDDSAGRELLDASRLAYERCLKLLPRDPLWHYGFADLLWSEYYWGVRASGQTDHEGLLPRALSELQRTLELDPGNQLARDMLFEISVSVDGAVKRVGDDFVLLALTATPPPPTAYMEPATIAPLSTPGSSRPTGSPSASPVGSPPTANPVCGSAAAVSLVPLAAILLRRRRPRT